MFRANALPPCESRDSEGQSISGVRRRRGGREGDQCDSFRPPTTSLRLPGQSWTRFGRAEGAERSLSSALAPQGPSPSSARAPVRGRASGFDALVPLSERTSSPDPAGPMMPGREFPTNVRAKMRDRSTPDRTDSPCFPRAGGLGLCRGLPVRSPQTTETEAGLSPMPPHCVFLRGRMSKPRTCHGSTCGFTTVVGKMTS